MIMQTAAVKSLMRDFDSLLADRVTPVLVDCFLSRCGPYAALTPVIDGLVGEMAGRLAVEKIVVASRQDVARRFSVRSVPMLLQAARTQVLTRLSVHGVV